MKVSEFLESLSLQFPLQDAEEWDNPGLSVGDPNAEINAVVCALDVTPSALRAAHDLGCNLLLTHHPVFIQEPNPISPEISTSSLAGTCIWLAAALGVNIISMHTNLDVSERAMNYLASMLGYQRLGRLEEPHGFGALLDVPEYEVMSLVKQCAQVFLTQPIVWDSGKPLNSQSAKVVLCSGSVGDCASESLHTDVRCIICGECGYHKCLELNEAGIDVIILGHDASEKPFAKLLADCASEISPDICIKVLDEPRRWQALA